MIRTIGLLFIKISNDCVDNSKKIGSHNAEIP